LNDEPAKGTKKICEKNQNPTDINKLDRDINRIWAAFLPRDGFCCEKSPCASNNLAFINKMGDIMDRH
jgi:hypothetical protein